MKQHKAILYLSLPLASLVILASCVGLFAPGFYAAESLSWQVQTQGQDIINLFIATPLLLIAAILVYRNNQAAIFIWAGIVLYLAYTFVIYCFGIHFNRLFVIYCFILGLSFYAFVYFLFVIRKTKFALPNNQKLIKITGIYFIFIAIAFCYLWLAEIIPAIIKHITPAGLQQTGLFTNPVQVIDLSVFLPGILLTGIALLRKKRFGFLFAPVLLLFFVIMDITIGALAMMMQVKDIAPGQKVALVMFFLSLLSILLLIGHLKNIKSQSA